MKKTTLAATLSTIIALSSSAYALDLLVIKNYEQATSRDLWKKVKPDQVPESLLSLETVESPRYSYANLFPKTFLQEDMYLVCYQDCGKADSFQTSHGEINEVREINWDVIEQANVYYWLKRYFTYLNENLHFQPTHYLKIMTNRDITEGGSKLQNNAFFNPQDITLNFLPAKNNLLFKLLQGKLNRSGFDPSVIAHETSHYVFFHLFPNNINNEINGVNEGFADYIANGFLDTPQIGTIMLQGNPFRDSSKETDSKGRPKIYQAGLESHDLGERVAFALWKTRSLVRNKNEFDRLVMEVVAETGRNMYSTAHDFKEKILARASTVVDSHHLKNVSEIWEFSFPGKAAKVESLSFLEKNIPETALIDLTMRQVLPENSEGEQDGDAVSEKKLRLHSISKISETQQAILIGDEATKTAPHWIVTDSSRGNILGIYNTNKKLLNDEKDFESIKSLITEARSTFKILSDFEEKVTNFIALSQGKGATSLLYKVIGKSTSQETKNFNGHEVTVKKFKIQLKRKLLTGILGAPEIESVEIYTLPFKVGDLPTFDNQSIVGYKAQLKNGSLTEVSIDSYPDKLD